MNRSQGEELQATFVVEVTGVHGGADAELLARELGAGGGGGVVGVFFVVGGGGGGGGGGGRRRIVAKNNWMN